MKVKELFAQGYGWTRNTMARDIDNKPVNPFSSEACQFCLMGAIIRCYDGLGPAPIMKRIQDYINMEVVYWNDTLASEAAVKHLVNTLDI